MGTGESRETRKSPDLSCGHKHLSSLPGIHTLVIYQAHTLVGSMPTGTHHALLAQPGRTAEPFGTGEVVCCHSTADFSRTGEQGDGEGVCLSTLCLQEVCHRFSS